MRKEKASPIYWRRDFSIPFVICIPILRMHIPGGLIEPELGPETPGWRIDYFVVSDDLATSIREASIHSQIEGSDHCPVALSLTRA